MTPHQADETADWPGILALIHRAFAGMEGRIDPPSSLHQLTAQGIADQARSGEVWLIATPCIACIFLTPKPHALYLGKLAVDPAHLRQGHARRLIDLAETRARARGLPMLELQTRVELIENHDVFRSLGFTQTAATAHPGFDRPTSLTFSRPVTGVSP